MTEPKSHDDTRKCEQCGSTAQKGRLYCRPCKRQLARVITDPRQLALLTAQQTKPISWRSNLLDNPS